MSQIWNFFTVVQEDPKYATCNECKAKISRGGSTPRSYGTSNLIGHLKKHPGVSTKYEEATAAVAAAAAAAKVGGGDADAPRDKEASTLATIHS